MKVRCVGVIRYTEGASDAAWEHVPLRASPDDVAAMQDKCRRQIIAADPQVVGPDWYEKLFDFRHSDALAHHWVNVGVGGALNMKVVR